MRFRVSLLVAFLFVVAACGGSTSPSSQASTAPVKINMGLYPPEAEQWSVYIAQSQKFLASNGVDFSPTVVQDTTKLATALVAGSLDVAAITPDVVLRAAAQGSSDLIVIGALVNSPSIPLVTDKAITSVSQLKGKKIGVSSITASDALFVKEILAKSGLQASDYELVQVGGSPARLAALTSGAIQATILSHPYDFVAQSNGFHLVASNTDVVPHYVWVALATTKTFAKTHGDALRKLLRALEQATRWFYDAANKSGSIAALTANVNVNQDVANLTYSFFQDKKVISPDLSVDSEGFQNVADFLSSTHQLDTSKIPPISSFIDSSYLS